MNKHNFILSNYSSEVESGSVLAEAPSNIALVKYWGKHDNQIPANPSLSLTLNVCKTTTSVSFNKKSSPSDAFSFDFFFENRPKESFRPKIQTFFERISTFLPFLKSYHFSIHSENTFPHSSGIASSASAMAALSKALMKIERMLQPEITTDFFLRKSSFLARLGSGSACRSLYPGIVLWGKHADFQNSSDLFGIAYPKHIHPVFSNYCDTILIVDKGEKTVSSSLGHQLMQNHPFAENRFKQAFQHISMLSNAIETGDLETFISIVESEALTLHAMMMTSQPYFILMKPNTLKIIELIWNFRKQHHIPISFTLDAGANLHVLYPKTYEKVCSEFIISSLIDYCENKNYICDYSNTLSNE